MKLLIKPLNDIAKKYYLNHNHYHKGDAVYLYKNGQKRGSFKGLSFKQALFGIWLGGKPADSSLKDDMLGLD